MNLAGRLRRTLGQPEPQLGEPWLTPPPAPQRTGLDTALTRYDALQARMARWAAPPDIDHPTLEEALGGYERAIEGVGAVWIVDYRLPLGHAHGEVPLAGFFDAPAGHLASLTDDPRLAGFDPSDAVFLDIEATGLDHGAGTLAFLIGLGFRDGDDFVVRQLVVRDPSDEEAALHVLSETLDRFRYLVSFNGKSYDLTVLQSRLVLHRLYSREQSALKLRPHLDLLHLSRNLYRDAWENTKLQTLERRALGFVRVDDIPGHLVPSCWFAWVRHGNPEPLAAVALHNLHDVLSMVTLGVRVVVDSKPEPDGDRPAVVALNLARLLYRRRRYADALAILDDLPHVLLEHDTICASLRLEAACARRLGDHARRQRALDALVDRAPDDRAALVALSIVTERARDRDRALRMAHRARALADDAAIRKRIARLERHLGAAAP